MKFNLKRCQIEIEPLPNSPGMFRVKPGKGCEFFDDSNVFGLEYLKEHFEPVDGPALDLVDPDRTERLCPQIIGG